MMARPSDNALAARLSQALGTSFSLQGEIGRGGMGVVFQAKDERLKRQVAIKVLPPDLAFREEVRLRFLREAETAARLMHPHIVPIHSVGESPDGLVYFVMAYIDGEPLSARLKRRGQLPAEESRGILIKQITEAAPDLAARVPGCPEDLAACVMRCLDKEPESRWPTADALRRALESRSAPPYRPRRSSAGTIPRRSPGLSDLPPLPDAPGFPIPRSPTIPRRGRPPSPPSRNKDLQGGQAGEPESVRRTRRGFVSWAAVCGGLTFVD